MRFGLHREAVLTREMLCSREGGSEGGAGRGGEGGSERAGRESRETRQTHDTSVSQAETRQILWQKVGCHSQGLAMLCDGLKRDTAALERTSIGPTKRAKRAAGVGLAHRRSERLPPCMGSTRSTPLSRQHE